MASSGGFSNAVLYGLQQQGFDDAAIAEVLGITLARLKNIRSGKARLTDRHLGAIERETGQSVGLLAALRIEPQGGPYTELATRLAKYRSQPVPRRRQTSKRAG